MQGKFTAEMQQAIKLLESKGFTVLNWKPSGDMPPHEEIECATALFRQLKKHDGFVAVKAEAPAFWNIVEPRTEDALLAALETTKPAEIDTVSGYGS